MCMEDYRIARDLKFTTYQQAAGGSAIQIKALADRVGLWIASDGADDVELFAGVDASGLLIARTSSANLSRYVSIAEIGQLMMGPFFLTTIGGTGVASAVETWLDKH